jgi:hypothetical protein
MGNRLRRITCDWDFKNPLKVLFYLNRSLKFLNKKQGEKLILKKSNSKGYHLFLWTRTYGDKIHINKIEKLSPTEFSEKTIETIMPIENSNFYKGIHTINSDGKYTVIDGKRFIFISENFIFQLKRKLYKLFKSRQLND